MISKFMKKNIKIFSVFLIFLIILFLCFYFYKNFWNKNTENNINIEKQIVKNENSEKFVEIDGIILRWSETMDITHLNNNLMWMQSGWRLEINGYWEIVYYAPGGEIPEEFDDDKFSEFSDKNIIEWYYIDGKWEKIYYTQYLDNWEIFQ